MAQKFVGYEVTKATAGYIRLLISKNNICTYTIYMATGYEVTKVTAGYSRLLIVKNACMYTYTIYAWLLVTRLQRLQQVTVGY